MGKILDRGFASNFCLGRLSILIIHAPTSWPKLSLIIWIKIDMNTIFSRLMDITQNSLLASMY